MDAFLNNFETKSKNSTLYRQAAVQVARDASDVPSCEFYIDLESNNN